MKRAVIATAQASHIIGNIINDARLFVTNNITKSSVLAEPRFTTRLCKFRSTNFQALLYYGKYLLSEQPADTD